MEAPGEGEGAERDEPEHVLGREDLAQRGEGGDGCERGEDELATVSSSS
jgi:hypothetical protein